MPVINWIRICMFVSVILVLTYNNVRHCDLILNFPFAVNLNFKCMMHLVLYDSSDTFP